jgi:hypothetical protein
MTTDSSSITSLTVEQARNFWNYLSDVYASINDRTPSKANRHEADRVRETMSEFYQICTGVKSFEGFSCPGEIENGLSFEQVSAMLSYIETSKCRLENDYDRIRTKPVGSSWDSEDMEQIRDQLRFFQGTKEKVEQIMRESSP